MVVFRRSAVRRLLAQRGELLAQRGELLAQRDELLAQRMPARAAG